MRRVRYLVASSLDGYTAGPKGETDWILMDPEIDFGAIAESFDTVLLGRKTFEPMAATGMASMPHMKTFVFSRTLQQRDYSDVTIMSDRAEETVRGLRASSGKDIWLFGGGSLFRSLAVAGLVDTIEVAVIPILLGGGVPCIKAVLCPWSMRLTNGVLGSNGCSTCGSFCWRQHFWLALTGKLCKVARTRRARRERFKVQLWTGLWTY